MKEGEGERRGYLEEDADEADEARLLVLVFVELTLLEAVRDIEVEELVGELDGAGEAVDDLHAVQRHVHFNEFREIGRDRVRFRHG